MKNAHIRVLIILAVMSLLGIVGTQVFWLNRAIEQQDQVFSYNVQVALRNVVESLCEANGKDFPTVNPVEQISGNYFIVRTNDRIDLVNLEYLISAEIKKRSISQDFEYGVYDCANDKMVYAENVNLERSEEKVPIPVLKNDEYYFGVYFPEKSRNLIAGFDLWKFTTAIAMVVIIFFGYALFVILRQKRLSEIQKDFINNVSHELKTPLATLSLASNSLTGHVNDKGNKYMDIIKGEVSRLKNNVDTILHASFSENRNTIQKENIQLTSFFNGLLQEFQSQYAPNMISWSLNLVAERSLRTDSSILEKILRNLVENAVKYGGENIQLDVFQDQKQTTISVIDDGQGIPKAHQNKIFKKFYRIPDTQHQHNQKGFGLGLQIVKISVRQLGGRIKLHSIEGKGSTFKITLSNG